MCKTGQITTFYVARGELIQIPCEVEAYPTDLMFQWTFNGSRDFADIPGSHYVADRLRSSLSYRPLTEQVSASPLHCRLLNQIDLFVRQFVIWLPSLLRRASRTLAID